MRPFLLLLQVGHEGLQGLLVVEIRMGLGKLLDSCDELLHRDSRKQLLYLWQQRLYVYHFILLLVSVLNSVSSITSIPKCLCRRKM